MEVRVRTGGGRRVVAEVGDFTIQTDQSVKNGGQASAPEPFDLLLAALGTCVGHYVFSYCEQRGIPFDNISLTQRCHRNRQTKKIEKVVLVIRLPAGVADRHHLAMVRSARLCTVKKQLDPSIEFDITTSV